MAPLGERAASLGTSLLTSPTARIHDLLVHGWQHDEAFVVGSNKSVHWVIFVLIVAHLLAYASKIKAHGWVRNYHLEAEFRNFDSKLLDLRRAILITVIDRQRVLDLEGQTLKELVCQTGFHYLAPVWLVRFTQHALHWTIELRQTADLVQDLFCGCEMLLNGSHEGWENILVEEDDAFQV